MSESIRQSNLFAAEDYKKVFKAYQFIDYTFRTPINIKPKVLHHHENTPVKFFKEYSITPIHLKAS